MEAAKRACSRLYFGVTDPNIHLMPFWLRHFENNLLQRVKDTHVPLLKWQCQHVQAQNDGRMKGTGRMEMASRVSWMGCVSEEEHYLYKPTQPK